MKRKTRFNDGGATGRFDEDLYARARRFVEEQERRAGEGMALSEEETPKAPRAAVKPPPVSDTYRSEGVGRGNPMAQEPATPPGQIPVDRSLRGPAKVSSPSMEMSETERQLSNTLNALSPGATLAAPAVGRGIGALASAAREGWREGEKIKQVARAAERGAKSRADIQAKRAARQKAEAEAMEKAKPILQSRTSDKAQRASRTRRTEEDMGIEFSKGGSASSRGDGCAKRGKTRGKMY
jgi:hypothetical protein